MTNKGDNSIDKLNLEVILIKQDGGEIERIYGLLGRIKPGESTELNVAITGNYVDAYDYYFNIKQDN